MLGLSMNLHTHLEGWVRPLTAREIAKREGIPAPAEGWERALRMSASGDLSSFLRHVAAVYPVLGSHGALLRVTREAVEDAAADGTAFLELRAGPTTHVRDDFPLEAVVEAMCEGLAEGIATTGMQAALVLAMLREFDEIASVRVVSVATRYRESGVVAIDLAGDEHRFPDLRPYARAFSMARDAGLSTTAHAAEAGSASAARHAHEILGVRRVGHGTLVPTDPELLTWAADNGMCFEVCPSSNVLTGAVPSLAAHPLKSMLEAGCLAVLGDDDPVTTGAPLSIERRVIERAIGLSPSQMRLMSEAALDFAFCDDVTRTALRARATAAI